MERRAEAGSARVSRHPGFFARRHGGAAVRPLVRADADRTSRSSAGKSDCRRIVHSCLVGSTASISAPDAELTFVRRWIEALRSHPSLADISILVRPHPFNSRHWSDADVGDLPNVAVYPHWSNPVNESDRQDYFDSLYHSEAVVGINTTAMIEAAIVGRTVHSVLAEEFKDTQGGTCTSAICCRRRRVPAGCTQYGRACPQVAQTLATPEIGRESCARFVRTFVRPHGIDVQTTPRSSWMPSSVSPRRRGRARGCQCSCIHFPQCSG